MDGLADERLAAMTRAALAGARALTPARDRAHRIKPDGTPQTAADLASDRAIRASLGTHLPGIPVVSEENLGDVMPRLGEQPFLLVDPLDGTREFLADHPDHAVCIALIENRRPTFGVIVAPRLRQAWTAGSEARAWGLTEELALEPGSRVLRLAPETNVRRVVQSRSRPDPFAAAVMRATPGAILESRGAVLKLVAVAEGRACLFPAGNPSSEWDIAAGDALVRAAGGCMLALDGEPVSYGNVAGHFLHPPYAAGASEAIVRAALAQWPAN
jgi:3'(2'), 5'-bisphosphate nucleotidase